MSESNKNILLEKIAQKIYEEILGSEIHGLHGGISGMALFLAYYAKFTDEQKYLDRAIEGIQKSMATIVEKEPVLTIASGWAGLGWTLAHFQKEGFLDLDLNEIFEDIHPHLAEIALQNISDGVYDFLHGGLGMAHYFIENENAPKREETLRKIAEKLETAAFENHIFSPWEERVFKERSKQTFNLGIPHGIPGIFSFFATLRNIGIVTKHTDNLLKSGSEWLLAQKLNRISASVFPKKIEGGKPLGYPCFLGWCYGDLSVSYALHEVGTALSHATIVKEALMIAQLATFRKIELAKVDNPYFCHGSAGVAFMFKKFADKTGNERYQEAANFWKQETLNYFETKEFQDFFDRKTEPLEHSLLVGISGIGLVLMSFLMDGNDGWRRAFML